MTAHKPVDKGYHLLTDDFRPIPWQCDDPGPLTPAEARNVLTSGHNHYLRRSCQIGRTARATLGIGIPPWPSVRRIAVRVLIAAVLAAGLAAAVAVGTGHAECVMFCDNNPGGGEVPWSYHGDYRGHQDADLTPPQYPFEAGTPGAGWHHR